MDADSRRFQTGRGVGVRVMRLTPFLLCLAHAQTLTGPVVIGDAVELPSKTLNETRTLLIAKPAGYDKGAERYPVLYLLDGETHFSLAASIVSFLSSSGRIPPMLVVGIASGGFQKRTHDLTPPSAAEIDNRFSPGNGGADTFLSFLAGELIPYVERTYRTRPYRLLAGHSFGGLFAIHALTTQPRLFQGYIAADPSLHWNSQAVIAQAESMLKENGALQADVYVSATDRTGEARLTAAFSGRPGLRRKFDWMPDQDHLSIPLPSLSQGLEAVFEPWRLTDPIALFNQGGIGAIHKRFREAGARFGYPERTTPPFTVSLVVAALLSSGRLEDATRVLLHDPAGYPPPWNQLDALARAYEKRGDSATALQFYRRSLEQNPNNDFARKKLAESSHDQ